MKFLNQDENQGCKCKAQTYGGDIPYYYTMDFMEEQGLAKSRSHAHFSEFAVVISMGYIDHFWMPID